MQKIRIGIVGVFLLLMAGAYAEPPEGYRFLSFDEGLRVASDREVYRLYTSNYVLMYVDTEGGSHLHLPSGERLTEADLAARLRVFATPLFVFMESGAKPIARTPGVKTVRDLVEMHQYVAEEHFRQLSLQEYQDGYRDAD